ncbi:diacylglyceryl transferase [Microbacterium paludicola]|uniref:Diacylglyceryl transferase n=1 Tax=Microbacterium paludicola TaxID=300019 RepID=A0A4Y9FUJ3_9MICO|nr:prolipoprotein diacylglyceryl transferase family protein [Microbacterium paludicola]MBF0816374.1 prolipoprotein diacylglyceryl transferase [Microbacterium paludicola]TFU32912.1 diacylglyceryl transferase [Microbacterium paludicola]
MFPTLQDLVRWLPPIDTHSFFVALGMLAAGIVFLVEKRRRGVTDHRIWYLVLGSLAGASILARLGTWAQHLDPTKNLSLMEQLSYGNASMLSALVGAWLGVHVAKRVVRYPYRTGDLFAPAVALAMAIGRIGCLLTEKPGTPTGSGWGIVLDADAAAYTGSAAGVPLHPSFVYEIAFHLVAFALLWFWLRHRQIAPGETLTLYIAAYGVFRFLVEFVRGNEIAWMGLTRPQLFLLATLPLLFARIVWMIRTDRFRAAAPAPALPSQQERTASREQHA